MDIYNYIDEYGIYTFDDKEFNDIDGIIFSFLSYANFENILNDRKLSIKEAGRMNLGLYKNNNKNMIAVKEANKILRYMKDTNRYKNCILFNYEYVGNNDLQFGALAIEYCKNSVYISFEGTNQLFSGWKEDFMLGYQFPTLSHQMAISYLNKYYTFSFKKIILGGHSKGGNLALVSAMYSNKLVRKKIIKIYNIDGPGLLDMQFYSQEYKKVVNKYKHIVPDYSLVGLFLNNSNTIVVKSNNKGILAHNIKYWQIKNNKLVTTTLSPFSKQLDIEIKKWLITYSSQDKEDFVSNLEMVMRRTNIKSILELRYERKKIINLIYESKDISNNTKNMLIDFVGIIIRCFRNVKKEEFKNFISDNMFNITKK